MLPQSCWDFGSYPYNIKPLFVPMKSPISSFLFNLRHPFTSFSNPSLSTYYLLSLIFFMFGLSYASVPLYQVFCRYYGSFNTFSFFSFLDFLPLWYHSLELFLSNFFLVFSLYPFPLSFFNFFPFLDSFFLLSFFYSLFFIFSFLFSDFFLYSFFSSFFSDSFFYSSPLWFHRSFLLPHFFPHSLLSWSFQPFLLSSPSPHLSSSPTPILDSSSSLLFTPKPLNILFSSHSSPDLPFIIHPCTPFLSLTPGDTALVFYSAQNTSSSPFSMVSTYTIIPPRASLYLNKVQCFCFDEQRLKGFESVELPILFFIDPSFFNDPKLSDLDSLTLSYSFYPLS